MELAGRKTFKEFPSHQASGPPGLCGRSSRQEVTLANQSSVAPRPGLPVLGQPGIGHAGGTGVVIELVSFTSGRRARMDSKTLSKVLHLAMFHGWTPERLTTQPPSASWDTEIIVPYIEPYLFGTVSDSDAAGLVKGLKRMLDSEALGLPLPVLFAAAAILAIAENGSFGIVTETPTEGSAQLPADSAQTRPESTAVTGS